jgi:hypothetical protein
MISRILHQHPDVLSISEFFTNPENPMVYSEGFSTLELDGQELWQVLTAPNDFIVHLVHAGLALPEFRYPLGKGRFTLSTGVPTICHSVLPMLTDDPDALFDKMAAEVQKWPRRLAADQFRALFQWLGDPMGRRVTVERSGGSVRLIRQMRRDFPEARFVHIYRDGPDCALSMSRHPSFRLLGINMDAMTLIGGSAPQDALADPELLAEQFEGLLAPPYDAERFNNYELPLPFFGQIWSTMVCEGMSALSEFPAEIWMSLKYEDLLADPDAELTRLAEFLGVPARPDWLSNATHFVDSRREGQARSLDEATQEALREACEPGMQAIAAVEAKRSASAVAQA